MRGELRIGCSGWIYKHWRGAFYPEHLPSRQWLEYYATQFDTVEINNTFYRLPEAKAFSAWRKAVSDDFLYAVKASRFLTHMKRLKEPAEPLERLFSRARNLRRALGPVLYQLPPRWNVDLARLKAFVQALPACRQHAIEFRDPSWYSSAVFDLLEKHGVALCVHDMEGSATSRIPVGPFVYARFHGPVKYGGRYDDRALDVWASWIEEQRRLGKSIYAYFNNDTGAHAPRDAYRLRARLLPFTSAAGCSSTQLGESRSPANVSSRRSLPRPPTAGRFP